MNTPSPLVPQGSFQDKGKSHVRITVFAILAIHVVLLGVLLIAGCNKKPEVETAENGLPSPPPPTASTDWPPSTPPATPGDTSVPALPPPVPTPLTDVPPPGDPGALSPVPAPAIVEQAPPPTAIESSAGFLTEHTILKGETLATIGKKYGVGYKAIEAANPGINPTRLKIGDKIKIPARTASTAFGSGTITASATTISNGTRIYVVKSGDNLLKISKTTGVSVKQLRAANNLRTDQIRVGQKLKIPVTPPTPPPAEAVAPPPVAPPSGIGNP